jgi:hypothetical protein
MALVRRKIDVQITLGTGDFGAGTGDTVTLSGLEVVASIQKAGLPNADTAQVQVYGMTQKLINQITRLGILTPDQTVRNTLTLTAGDDVSGMSQIYQGDIITALGDFASAPDAFVSLNCMADSYFLKRPVNPISFNAGTQISVIMSQIAALMGKGFVNNGVTGTVDYQYLTGTAVDMMNNMARIANINVEPNGPPNGSVIIISPKGQAYNLQAPLISSSSGLVGYPRYSDNGIAFTTLFMPGLQINAPINLQTSETPVSGTWYPTSIVYNLATERPNAPWFIDVTATKAGGNQ